MIKRVGILGGGQLGMMLAGSLFKCGVDVYLYDPDPSAPARRRYANVTTGAWTDRDALARFVDRCDVLTYEFENADPDALAAIVGTVPVFPSLDVLRVTQHRVREKEFCKRSGLPVTRFAAATGRDQLVAEGRAFGFPFLVKTARGGYDGKGQHRIADDATLVRVAEGMHAQLGEAFEVVLEAIVPLTLEASCIVARSQSGEESVFPVFENQHENHVLDVTLVPARVPPGVAAKMQELALLAARELGVVGLLTTEFFLAAASDGSGGARVGDVDVFVNEFAPRPHNSGHVTRSACNFSQFDAHARVLVGMPIGTPRLMAGGTYVMGNLLGDLWAARGAPELDFSAWARHPEVLDILLYGKNEARPGRKMGHFVAHADTADAALAAARAFRRDLAAR